MRLDPAIVRQQIDNLKAACPEAFEDGEEQLLHDMLEGETDTMEFLTIVADRMQDAAFTAGGIATRIAELELRQRRFEQREKAMRGLAFKVMQAAGLRKAELSEATLSVAKGAARLVINDDASVPADFQRVKTEPDKEKIKSALKDGASFNWAALVPGDERLSVRTK